jgi:hypothetical protein
LAIAAMGRAKDIYALLDQEIEVEAIGVEIGKLKALPPTGSADAREMGRGEKRVPIIRAGEVADAAIR